MEMATGLYCKHPVLECSRHSFGYFIIRNLSGSGNFLKNCFLHRISFTGHRLCMVYLYFFILTLPFLPSVRLYFCRGVAQGLLFTPLVFFLISGTPEEYVSNATALGTTTRFWTTAIGYALMQNLMLFLTLKHSDALSANLTDTNPVFYNQWSQIFGANISKLPVNDSLSMTAGAFKAKITAQSILLSNMEIFTGLFWLALITAIGLLLYHPVK